VGEPLKRICWIAIELFMRVEYFADGSVDCPLLLLYGADPKDAASLSKALRGLSESGSRLAIHELPGFSSVAGCRLFASRSGTDMGVKMIQSPNQFECSLRALSWENIVGLLEPFCHKENTTVRRFQYLDENGDIR
jgi:hypothetical protein